MKPITLSPELKKRCLRDIAAQLENYRTNDCIKFEYNLKDEELEDPIILNFTAMAYLKMRTLIEQTDSECAWHGITSVSEDRKTFTVHDIVVYPQIVKTTTVEQDDTNNAYEIWHQALPDELYNNMRMQGHSHVQMRATPSGRDTQTMDNMLQNISQNGYYIFIISNKQGNNWVNIFDIKKNANYNNNDIEILIEGIDLYAWYHDNKISNFKTITHTSANLNSKTQQNKIKQDKSETLYKNTYGTQAFTTWPEYYK